jgi:hypothetical protein
MWSCTVQLDEEKSKNMPVWLRKVVLAQHHCTLCNGFVMMHSLQWLVKGAATVVFTSTIECNKYDMTAVSVSDWPILMIRADGLLFSSPPLIICWWGCKNLNS